MPVRSLGYIRLATREIEAWRAFAGDFLGMMPVDGPDDSSLYYRMDDHPPRLVVRPGDEHQLEAIGFEVRSREELDEVAAAVEATGAEVAPLDRAECRDRSITGGVRFADPGGTPLELVYGPVLDHKRVLLPHVSAFVTGRQGMGHVVLTAPDGPAAYNFYTGALGFVGRNTLSFPGAPGPDGKAHREALWFLGCNPRHHTVGILPMTGPGRLVHFMVEAAEIDDVGRAIDRAESMNVPVMQTLGRHTNDRMVSFYVIGPDGFAVEFGWDGLQVGGDEPVYEITEGAFWGHKFVNFPSI